MDVRADLESLRDLEMCFKIVQANAEAGCHILNGLVSYRLLYYTEEIIRADPERYNWRIASGLLLEFELYFTGFYRINTLKQYIST